MKVFNTVDKCDDNYVANGVEMERKHQVECGGDGKAVSEAFRAEVKLPLNEEALGTALPREGQRLEKVKEAVKEAACV